MKTARGELLLLSLCQLLWTNYKLNSPRNLRDCRRVMVT